MNTPTLKPSHAHQQVAKKVPGRKSPLKTIALGAGLVLVVGLQMWILATINQEEPPAPAAESVSVVEKATQEPPVPQAKAEIETQAKAAAEPKDEATVGVTMASAVQVTDQAAVEPAMAEAEPVSEPLAETKSEDQPMADKASSESGAELFPGVDLRMDMDLVVKPSAEPINSVSLVINKPAKPALPAVPAQPATAAIAASPATPAIPAQPAQPVAVNPIMVDWLQSAQASDSGRNYTLQLISARKIEPVIEYYAAMPLDAPAELLHLNRNGSQWYAVVSGVYETGAQARAVAAAVLAETGKEAWVRPISEVLEQRESTLRRWSDGFPAS